jgi:hypothetical protein
MLKSFILCLLFINIKAQPYDPIEISVVFYIGKHSDSSFPSFTTTQVHNVMGEVYNLFSTYGININYCVNEVIDDNLYLDAHSQNGTYSWLSQYAIDNYHKNGAINIYARPQISNNEFPGWCNTFGGDRLFLGLFGFELTCHELGHCLGLYHTSDDMGGLKHARFETRENGKLYCVFDGCDNLSVWDMQTNAKQAYFDTNNSGQKESFEPLFYIYGDCQCGCCPCPEAGNSPPPYLIYNKSNCTLEINTFDYPDIIWVDECDQQWQPNNNIVTNFMNQYECCQSTFSSDQVEIMRNVALNSFLLTTNLDPSIEYLTGNISQNGLNINNKTVVIESIIEVNGPLDISNSSIFFSSSGGFKVNASGTLIIDESILNNWSGLLCMTEENNSINYNIYAEQGSYIIIEDSRIANAIFTANSVNGIVLSNNIFDKGQLNLFNCSISLIAISNFKDIIINIHYGDTRFGGSIFDSCPITLLDAKVNFNYSIARSFLLGNTNIFGFGQNEIYLRDILYDFSGTIPTPNNNAIIRGSFNKIVARNSDFLNSNESLWFNVANTELVFDHNYFDCETGNNLGQPLGNRNFNFINCYGIIENNNFEFTGQGNAFGLNFKSSNGVNILCNQFENFNKAIRSFDDGIGDQGSLNEPAGNRFINNITDIVVQQGPINYYKDPLLSVNSSGVNLIPSTGSACNLLNIKVKPGSQNCDPFHVVAQSTTCPGGLSSSLISQLQLLYPNCITVLTCDDIPHPCLFLNILNDPEHPCHNHESNEGEGKPAINEINTFLLGDITNETSDIQNLTNKLKVKTFPNPSNNILNVKLESTFTSIKFILYDLNGKEIISMESDQNLTTLDVSNLNNGIYFLQVIVDEIPFETEKVLIIK